MEGFIITFSAIVTAIILLFIALFQMLLSLGYPLGEFALGGKYKVLPKKHRITSAVNAFILLFMGYSVLLHANIFFITEGFPNPVLIWIITIFLGFHALANFVSQSKKEKLVMTPISTIAFLLSLIIALS
ncbi:hypothetical protein [Evansella cellulosilytica]|uniref:DUF1304 domain-containing protein n=1 Tax=Evansella cellulosilytica (strain ATCC 21833 / DSM 2522 / FERM P-1141 / JCM 9156 / N-4) TaxID=649639 RepID=E6TR59_EVAC2|nr:hypothetical protein [Evansella cellulosilytica]ADU30571.1 hypothetical protein Bcell_2311 [Evansella cellulosilytica DSM 2522]